jgi:hypothetical protein
MNNAINSFLKFVPSEDWICKSSGLPWIELHMATPVDLILTEANQLYSQAVLHRSKDNFGNYSHQGWKSLTIYGELSTITENTTGKKTWTNIVDQCPDTVDFIKQHWEINEQTGRIRFMWLDPGGYIFPHHDREFKGFFETNIAINNPENCQFRFLNYGTVPFKSGSAFLVDISNKHFVINNSDQVRTHIIVHSKLKPNIIKSSYAHSFYS